MNTPPRKKRRTANACVACRESKIKCSGNEPCTNCQRRSIRCEFTRDVNKVVVSESYLRQLEAQVRNQQNRSSTKSSTSPFHTRSSPQIATLTEDSATYSEIRDTSPLLTASQSQNIWTSPFSLPSTTIKNTQKNKRSWIWLAPSSMWSFTTRLTILLTEKLYNHYPHSAPTLVQKEIYPLKWNSSSAAREAPDISGLPSVDYALYVFETVKFHLGQSYRFFDEDKFVHKLSEFYHGEPAAIANEDRLWFIQFLLVLSFGTALLCRSNTDEPPGSKFFVRAMSLMPDHASLWKDSLMAIEALALAALYLYSIDIRESAYIYLGQAIRIAQFEGLHTQLSEEQLGAGTVSRCRNLWWTLYIMDRHFSCSVGLPMTTQDSDISVLMDPPGTSHRDVALSLQAKLSHLLSSILQTVYKSEKTRLSTFLDTTSSILQTLAGHAQEVEDIIHVRFRNSVDTLPKGTRHITLLYHHCVIVATRPLLLSALKERLENLDNEKEDWQEFLSLTKILICAGIKSATKTLQILSNNDAILEVFLLYDLEFAYGAAIHLAMASALFPQEFEAQAWSGEAHGILSKMIGNGNRVAQVRRDELAHLESLFRELALRAESRGLQPLTLRTPDGPAGQVSQIGHRQEPVDDSGSLALPTPQYLQTPEPTGLQAPSVDFLDSIGISSAEFFCIVDQINNPGVPYSILDHGSNGYM